MRFAAVFQRDMRAAPWAVAPAAAVGTWTRLYVAAADVEQGGKIPDCEAYEDRQWLALALVTRAEIGEAVAAGLAWWESPHLIVAGYDLDGETKIKAARENGQKGGRPPKQKTEDKPSANRAVSSGLTHDKPSPNPSASASAVSGSGSSPREGGGGGDTAPPLSGGLTVRDLIAEIRPLWAAKYSTRFVADREGRRSLGQILATFRDAGAEAELSQLPVWYAAFLSDSREAYVSQRHALRQFAADLNTFRISLPAARRANGHLTPAEYEAAERGRGGDPSPPSIPVAATRVREPSRTHESFAARDERERAERRRRERLASAAQIRATDERIARERRQTGRCEKCGTYLGGESTCPKCGAAADSIRSVIAQLAEEKAS